MLGLGLGLGIYRRGGPDKALIANMFATSQIAGRDGSIATTRTTNRWNPVSNTLIGNNLPVVATIVVAGQTLNLYGAWPTATNLALNNSSTQNNANSNKSAGTLTGIFTEIFTLSNKL